MTSGTHPVRGLARRALRPARLGLAALACTIALAGQAVVASVPASAATSPWSVQQSPPLDTATPNAQFRDVSCPTRTSCTAVGQYVGTDGIPRTFVERWNGGWHIVSSPNTPGAASDGLGQVSCVSATACEALGSSRAASDSIMAESWNGHSWRMVPIQKPGPTTFLTSVSCATASACMAVGFRATSGDKELAISERWNGQQWRIVTARSPVGLSELLSVSCPGPRTCTAVGIAKRSFTTSAIASLVEHWNGTRWSVETVKAPPNSALASVSCPTTTSCTAVGSSQLNSGGDQRMLVEDARRGHWTFGTPTAPQALVDPGLEQVSCSATRVCTAILGYVSSDEETSDTTATRGASGGWSVAVPATDVSANTLAAISCRPVACTAVGGLNTTDGQGDNSGGGTPFAERGTGNHLVAQTTPNPVGTAGGTLSHVSCVASGFCAATVADAPSSAAPMAEVREAGHWTASLPRSSPGSSLQDVSCTSASFCLALGVESDAERWNGTGWSTVAAPDHYNPSQITGLAAISCTSASSCVAVGSTDSSAKPVTEAASWDGTGWTTVAPPNPVGARSSRLSSVSCTSATQCVATGVYFQASPNPNVGHALIESLKGTTWTLASPNFRVASFQPTDVSCASASACMAVWAAQGGVSQAEWWNGVKWTATTVVGPTARTTETNLNGVSCTSATACTAAGFSEFHSSGPLVENWNGAKWTVTPSPNPVAGIGSFADVSCTSPTVCTAVGSVERALVVPLVEVRG